MRLLMSRANAHQAKISVASCALTHSFFRKTSVMRAMRPQCICAPAIHSLCARFAEFFNFCAKLASQWPWVRRGCTSASLILAMSVLETLNESHIPKNGRNFVGW